MLFSKISTSVPHRESGKRHKLELQQLKVVWVPIVLLLLLLSAMPYAAFGDTDPYQSTVDAPSLPARVQQAVDGTKEGAEFTVTLVGDPPSTIYAGTSRPTVDCFYYKNTDITAEDPDEWKPLTIGTYAEGKQIVEIPIGAPYTIYLNQNAVELKIKVISTAAGTSQVVFGTDAKDVDDYARSRSMTANSLANIIRQTRFPVEFTSDPPGSGSLQLLVPGYDFSPPDENGYRRIIDDGSGNLIPASSSDGYNVVAFFTESDSFGDIPVVGVRVYFTVESGFNGIALASTAPVTNTVGRAENRIWSANPGDVAIRAWTTGGLEDKIILTFAQPVDIPDPKYTVAFLNGNSVYATKIVVPPASTIDTMPADPTKGSDLFNGWWYEGTDGRMLHFDASTPVTSDMLVSAYWSGSESEGPVSPYLSGVYALSDSVPIAVAPNKDSEGSLFTIALVGEGSSKPAGNIYIASGRPSKDSFYYWHNGDWHPVPVSASTYGAGTIDVSYAEDVLPTKKEVTVKVVSTAPGGSQIVFGIDPHDTVGYALGRHMLGFANIIQQRRYPAWFFSPLRESAYDLYVGGQKTEMDIPLNKAGNEFLAPFRGFTEAMGLTAAYDGALQQVTFTDPKNNDVLILSYTMNNYSFNSTVFSFIECPRIVDGRLIVPVQPVAEKFGYGYYVDDRVGAVHVYQGVQPPDIVLVAYDSNGGTGSIVGAKVLKGNSYAIAENTFSRSGYAFNGWNTAADGSGAAYAAGATIPDVQADSILYAQWRVVSTPPGGGSSSGGGGGAGGGPATITGGDGTVALMYNLSDGVVNLFLLEDEVKKIIDVSHDNRTVFDLSRLANGTGVTMPKASLQDIVNEGMALQFKMPKGTVAFDTGAAKSLITQASGNNVSLSLKLVEPSGLTAAQQAATNPGDLVYSISMDSGAATIRDFGGTVSVSLPYDGPTPVYIWYLDNAGNLEKVPCSYNATTKAATFNTNHLSLYIVGSERDSVTKIRLTIGSLSYTVGAVAKTLDTAPEIVNGRTMVPLRFIAEALGATVTWDGDSSTATVELGGVSLAVTISHTAPGMDVPAMMINNRTMVPLRYISETLGCEVVWSQDTQTVDISKKRAM